MSSTRTLSGRSRPDWAEDDMDNKWERRDRKKRNARKMKVDGAGIRGVWRQIVEKAKKLSDDKPSKS